MSEKQGFANFLTSLINQSKSLDYLRKQVLFFYTEQKELFHQELPIISKDGYFSDHQLSKLLNQEGCSFERIDFICKIFGIDEYLITEKDFMEKVFLISHSSNETQKKTQTELEITYEKCFIQYFIENIQFFSEISQTNFVVKFHDLNYLMDFCIFIFDNDKKEFNVNDLLGLLKENATQLSSISIYDVLLTLKLFFKSNILSKSIFINFIKRFNITSTYHFCSTPKKINNHNEDLIKTIKPPRKNITYTKKLFFENPQLPNTFADIYRNEKKTKIFKNSIENNKIKFEHEKYIENSFEAENLFQHYLMKIVEYFYENEKNKEIIILCGDFCLEKFCQIFENDKNYFLNEIIKSFSIFPEISDQEILKIIFEIDSETLRSNLLLQFTPKDALYEKLLSAKENIFKRTKLNKNLDFKSCFTNNTKSKILKFFKDKIFNELDLIGIEEKINSKFNVKNYNKRADISKSEMENILIRFHINFNDSLVKNIKNRWERRNLPFFFLFSQFNEN